MKAEMLAHLLPFFLPFIFLLSLLALYDYLSKKTSINHKVLVFGIIAPSSILIILLLKSFLIPKEVFLMQVYPYLCHGSIKAAVLSCIMAGLAYGLFLKREAVIYLITVAYSFTLCVALASGAIPLEDFLIGDNWYLTTGITRYISTWQLNDFTSKDDITFYPPLQSFIYGKIAAILHLKSFQMLIIGNLATMVFGIYLLFYLNYKRINGILNVIIVSIIICFSLQEISEKPYQLLSACLSLLFYFEIEKEKLSTKKAVILGILGGVLALYYYYFFFIMAIAWGLKLVWLFHTKAEKPLFKEHFQKLFPYTIAFFILATFFLIPLSADIKMAPTKTSYFAYFGSIMDIQWPHNWMFYLPGFLFILINYKERPYLSLLFFAISLAMVTVLHIFSQFLFLNSLRVAKLDEFYPIIFIPFTVLLASEALPRLLNTKPKDENTYKVLLFLVLIYSFNHSANRFYKPQNMKTHDSTLMNEIDLVKKNIDIENKVVYTLNHFDRLEYGPFINSYRFMPTNIDYAAPGFDYDSKAAFVEELLKVDNPAEVALVLMNNKFTKIDFIATNNRVTVQLPYQMGFAPALVDSLKENAWLSAKYFPIASASIPYLRKVDYTMNFKDKPASELNLLEKLARKLSISNLPEALKMEIINAEKLKDTAYLESLNYYVLHSKQLTIAQKAELKSLFVQG